MNRVMYGSQSQSECSSEVSVVGNEATILTPSWPVVQGRFRTNALYAAALVPTILGPRIGWMYFRLRIGNILYVNSYTTVSTLSVEFYRGADKSLARPGRKQALKHVRVSRDFNNIEMRAVIKFFFPAARQGAEGNSRHSDVNISLFPSWLG